ncbi:AAA family ATPase [Homoserinimonas sp. A520]
MVTGYERYSRHAVWESLRLKRESLNAARFDNAESEQWREDIVEWLDEALKTRAARQPALYLSTLDALSAALNELPVDTASFQQFIEYRQRDGHAFKQLEQALRSLPLPAPRDLKASYVELLDQEVNARNERLGELEQRISESEKSLGLRLAELEKVSTEVRTLHTEIQTEREAIAAVSKSAESEMRDSWNEVLEAWGKNREATDLEHDTQALASIATLAATTKAGEALAEHAAGDLSAADWYGRAKRERIAARWIRFGAWAAFIFAGAVGFYIVNEAIIKNFDISVGGGILRASIAVVIGAFGALLLREAGRHFREADTAEDVALALRALAPFYANSGDGVRLTARVQLGDAVLVKNVLSRFSHRDAAKHAGEIKTDELPGLVKEATSALKLAENASVKP